ncbi:MAG: HPr kinase/phosphorylase [Alphaproteobacteria bacterium]
MSRARRTTSVHGTAVELDGIGVLLRGPPGSGKSDLALRLIDGGARLVADDRCVLKRERGRIMLSVPPAIAGLLEVRGVGVVAVALTGTARLGLVVDLVADGRVARLPGRARCRYLGVPLARLALAPFEASAAAKVRLAARRAARETGPGR